ncbi:PREDICTED: CTD nuclear envelope phosphatase 1-like [Camelina sativa]|uniref:CTD nuclear envelope phosphatase 1-like n=1 Tax=Camelina sativa TaxID=90675 RepID=A0ABM0UIL3_CAMSA|nr:PREDICTED: CTD nuclear envelope phosphatase 1-like [Camelina sativa]
MATKLILKKATKSINRHPRNYLRRHRKSQIGGCSPSPTATTVIATINKSIYRCHRSFLCLFSRHGAKGFKILKPRKDVNDLHQNSPPAPYSLFQERSGKTFDETKKTIVLDLDETLVHSSMEKPDVPYDFVINPKIDGQMLTFYVIKRPGVDEFLKKIGEQYQIVVFTAGLREYASLVLDKLDPDRGVISRSFYRDACSEIDGRLVKDLGFVLRDMRRVVIVDDNPNSYALQPENAFPIKPFSDDLGDAELEKLGEFLNGDCVKVEDMRVALKEFVGRDE